jgi:hypothetical protein
MVKVRVEPGVQPVVAKSNSPCGKTMPAGAVPAGGLAGSPVSGMNRALAKVHVGPPPVRPAVIVPVPVGDVPVMLLLAATTNDCETWLAAA